MFIRSAMNIIELVFAPAHIIIIGPRATLGKELSIVKNGSITFAKNLFIYIKTLNTNAINVPKINEIKTSLNVTPMCIKISFDRINSKRVLSTLVGEENINEFIKPNLELNSQKSKKIATAEICVMSTLRLYLDI